MIAVRVRILQIYMQGYALMADENDNTAGQLRERHVSMIAIGGVIGAGLFVGSSAAISRAGPAVLLAYIFAGIQTMMIMRMLGEMVLNSPRSGSFIIQIRRGLGPHAAFVAGWAYWILWAIIAGTEVIAGAGLIENWISLPRVAIEGLLIAIMTASNLFSVRGYGEFEYWLSFMKISAVCIFITVCVLSIFGLINTFPIQSAVTAQNMLPHGVLAVITIIPTIMMSLTGSEIATVAALETRNPSASVARAANSVPIKILLFYVISVALILYILPVNDVHSGFSPFLATLTQLHIPYATTAMAFVMFIAVMSCLNSAIYVTSRVMMEMATFGDAPFFLAKRGSTGVPTAAIIMAAGVEAIVALFSTLSPGGIFTFLLSASGALILFDYFLAALAQIRLRKKMIRQNQTPDCPMWLFPILSYLTAGSFLLVLVIMMFEAQTRFEIEFSSFIVIVITSISLFRNRCSGIKSNEGNIVRQEVHEKSGIG